MTDRLNLIFHNVFVHQTDLCAEVEKKSTFTKQQIVKPSTSAIHFTITVTKVKIFAAVITSQSLNIMNRYSPF